MLHKLMFILSSISINICCIFYVTCNPKSSLCSLKIPIPSKIKCVNATEVEEQVLISKSGIC